MKIPRTHGTYICFGDSNTWGYDPKSLTGDPYPEQKIWPGILAERTGCTVRNYGVCGRQVPCGYSAVKFICSLMESWRNEPAPVRLLIMLGSNDLLQNPGFTAQDAGKRMEYFLRCLIDTPTYTSGDAGIILISPPHMAHGTWVLEERIIKEALHLDSVYKNLAERLGIGCIISGDVPLSHDGVHLTAEGHRIFAERLIRQLAAINEL